MITIDSKVYTEDKFLDIYREQYGDGIETWGRINPMGTRRERGMNKYTTSNPLFILAIDENGKMVGNASYNDNGSFIHYAGVSVHQDHRKKDIGTRLIKKVMEKIDEKNKPAVVSFNVKVMPMEKWKETWSRVGYIDSPEHSELNEETRNAIPLEVIEYNKSKYGDAYMVYPIGSKPMAKAWAILYKGGFHIVKESGGISFGTGDGALHGRSFGGKKYGKKEKPKDEEE
jgi:GNAT superfamily N-acetyltransferase